MIRQVIHQWFWDCYDLLGRLIVLNVCAFLALLPIVYNGLILWADLAMRLPPILSMNILAWATGLLLITLGTIWFAGMLHIGRMSTNGPEPHLADFLHGARRRLTRVLPWTTIAAIGTALLILNVWFYSASGSIQPPLLGAALSGLCIGLAVGATSIIIHALPIAVAEDLPPWPATIRAAKRLARHPLGTIGILLFIASFWIVSIYFKLAGVLVFAFSFTLMLLNSLHDVLSEEELKDAPPSPTPKTWAEVHQAELKQDELDWRKRRYERSLRDVLKPWEMDHQ